jgi:hypothetical protein
MDGADGNEAKGEDLKEEKNLADKQKQTLRNSGRFVHFDGESTRRG